MRNKKQRRLSINITYKLVVLDIDGTLLDKNGSISERDKTAVQTSFKAGYKISLCTGRACNSTLNVIANLGLNGFHIFCDGALISNSDLSVNVFSAPIEKSILQEFVSATREYGLVLELYSQTDSYADHHNWITEIQNNFFGLNYKIIDFNKELPDEDIIKGGMVTSSQQEERIVNSLGQRFSGELYFSWAKTPAYPDLSFINITRNDVSKGKSLNYLMEYLNIYPDQVLAIGDGANDVSLFSAAGFSIAMGNASEELKAKADYITADVDNNGVAQALEHFILNSKNRTSS